MKPILALALAAVFCAALAAPALAQFPRIRGRVGDVLGRVEKTAKDTEITTEQEVAIGKEVAAKMIAYFKVFENAPLQAYVRKVGEGVALQSERQDVSYHFEILDTPVINAFAAPGGFIFVTRGLLENITTESELAGVLAHEVAHVSGKHVVKALQRGKLIQSGMNEASAFTPGSQYLDNISRTVLERIIDRGLDPADEQSADQQGLTYAYNAGYPPDGLRNFLVTFDQVTAESQTKGSWLTRTHPPAKERVARLDKMIADRNMERDRANLQERYQAAVQAALQAAAQASQ